MSQRQDPPESVKERFEERDGTVVDHGDPHDQREEECEQLRESVDWSEAPDYARLLYLEIQQLRGEQ